MKVSGKKEKKRLMKVRERLARRHEKNEGRDVI